MKAEGYEWWVERLRWATQNCDYIRLDHFRGFDQFWEIPAGDPTAINGRWVDGPRDDLFHKLREDLGGLPFFAEDLGYITPEVNALRESACRFRGWPCCNSDLATRARTCICRIAPPVRSSTREHMTMTRPWAGSTPGPTEQERRNAEAYLGRCDDGIHWAFIRAAQTSPAEFALIPLQDVLGLGSEARMNTPSLHGGNWKWRFAPGQFTAELAAKLAHLAEVTDRLPQPMAVPLDEDFAA